MAARKTGFNKETFKKQVKENVKALFRKTLEEANEQQVYQAVAYTVKDTIIDNWLETQKAYEKQDPKTVYYLSMEFLMGRALGNAMINLKEYKEVAEALDELGINIDIVEDQERDPALGNGGLGRLAACFLDSLATLGYNAYGCGIRYRYGMFRQKIKDGFQVEVPDNWLKDGYPFELRRPEYAKIVKFGGNVVVNVDEKGENHFSQENYQSVQAIPYDLPIPGYGNGTHSLSNVSSLIRLIKVITVLRLSRRTLQGTYARCCIPMTTIMPAKSFVSNSSTSSYRQVFRKPLRST